MSRIPFDPDNALFFILKPDLDRHPVMGHDQAGGVMHAAISGYFRWF
jgi:hypothetical protein